MKYQKLPNPYSRLNPEPKTESERLAQEWIDAYFKDQEKAWEASFLGPSTAKGGFLEWLSKKTPQTFWGPDNLPDIEWDETPTNQKLP